MSGRCPGEIAGRFGVAGFGGFGVVRLFGIDLNNELSSGVSLFSLKISIFLCF